MPQTRASSRGNGRSFGAAAACAGRERSTAFDPRPRSVPRPTNERPAGNEHRNVSTCRRTYSSFLSLRLADDPWQRDANGQLDREKEDFAGEEAGVLVERPAARREVLGEDGGRSVPDDGYQRSVVAEAAADEVRLVEEGVGGDVVVE